MTVWVKKHLELLLFPKRKRIMCQLCGGMGLSSLKHSSASTLYSLVLPTPACGIHIMTQSLGSPGVSWYVLTAGVKERAETTALKAAPLSQAGSILIFRPQCLVFWDGLFWRMAYFSWDHVSSLPSIIVWRKLFLCLKGESPLGGSLWPPLSFSPAVLACKGSSTSKGVLSPSHSWGLCQFLPEVFWSQGSAHLLGREASVKARVSCTSLDSRLSSV